MKKIITLIILFASVSCVQIQADKNKTNNNNAYVIFFDNPWRITKINTVYGLNLGLPITGKTESVEGFDLGLFYSSIANIYGLQISILSNESNLVEGIEASLIWNTVQKNLDGIQISGYTTVKNNLTGFQAGVVCNVEHDCSGLQAASINTVNNKLTGCQIGLLNWATIYMKGLQIGGLNTAGRLNGLQIGLINKAKRGSGLQIGLFNYIEDSFIPFLPIINYHR